MDTKNKFQMDTHGEMLTQINIPAQSENGVLPQQGDTKPFQKNNPKLLERVSIGGKNGAVVSRSIKKGRPKLTGMQCCFLDTWLTSKERYD